MTKKESDRRYYLKNKEKVRAVSKKWKEDNPEKVQAWKENNKEKIAASRKKYNQEHKKEKAAYAKAYREKDPEKVAAQYKRWHDNNKERRSEYGKKRHRDKKNEKGYEEYRNKKLAYYREYYQRNKEQFKVYSSTRRARVAKVGGKFTKADIRNMHLTQWMRCYYCSVSIEKEYHIDHMTPITQEGSNWVDNLCLTCPECNMTKHTQTAEEFIEQKGFMDGI